jgi:hypothetical protein
VIDLRDNADGSENYSRMAKSIVQVGAFDAVQLTDRAGRATFTMPHDGTWLLNVIWTTPLPLVRNRLRNIFCKPEFRIYFQSMTADG